MTETIGMMIIPAVTITAIDKIKQQLKKERMARFMNHENQDVDSGGYIGDMQVRLILRPHPVIRRAVVVIIITAAAALVKCRLQDYDL